MLPGNLSSSMSSQHSSAQSSTSPSPMATMPAMTTSFASRNTSAMGGSRVRVLTFDILSAYGVGVGGGVIMFIKRKKGRNPYLNFSHLPFFLSQSLNVMNCFILFIFSSHILVIFFPAPFLFVFCLGLITVVSTIVWKLCLTTFCTIRGVNCPWVCWFQ